MSKKVSRAVNDSIFFILIKVFETPTRDARGSDRLVQPSPTINTKEAFCLMQQMWGKSEDSSNRKKCFACYRVSSFPYITKVFETRYLWLVFKFTANNKDVGFQLIDIQSSTLCSE